MKTNYFNLNVVGMFIMGVIAAGSASAADFPITTALKQASVTQGFGKTSLAVLHREAAASQAQVRAALLGKLCAGCAVTDKAQGANLEITGEHLSLSIAADGTAADFRDLSVEEKAHSLAKPAEDKMSQAALEEAGRTFVASKLADVIVLGPGEQLVPLLTDYRIEGLQNLSTGAVTRSVAANRVMFGRTINGVPVVGNGSAVVVTFANDGSVESFHYDWPKYETAAAQGLVSAAGLLDRVQKVVSARTGLASAFTVKVPSVTEAAGTVNLNTDTKLESLQCGYYDAGSAAGHAQVQPGCVYRAVFADATGMRQGYAGAVPGGLVFEADAKWLETQILKP